MLFIDSHEPQEIINELTRRNLDVKVQVLDSGDYVFGDVGIERKTVSDFVASITPVKGSFLKPRLWSQLEVLKATYEVPILLIEGNLHIERPFRAMFSPDVRLFLGARSTILLNWRIPIIQTNNAYETARTIESLFVKYGIGKSGNVPPIGVRKSSTPSEIKWYMLQCISGIGPKTARKILDEYPWFGDLRSRSAEEIAKSVKGLSRKKADVIVRVFAN